MAFYIKDHTDHSSPALPPIFVSPGGPGASIWADQGYFPHDDWGVHHDTVLLEPRGVGASGLIRCKRLEAGPTTTLSYAYAAEECADQLGPSADRYGSGDIALDIEDVRKALGVDKFDYYAASYGTVVEQAYAARFGDHLDALVLDSGFSVTDAVHSYGMGVGYAQALIRVLALRCSRDRDCAAAYPDPPKVVEEFVHRVATEPAKDYGRGATKGVIVDEVSAESILSNVGAGGDEPQPILDAMVALKNGDQKPILRVGLDHPLIAPSGGHPESFSQGDNMAAYCNDQDFPWDRSDPLATRQAKFAAAVAAFPKDTFAPWTPAGWNAWNFPAQACMRWPAPSRFEPVIPAGATFPKVPTLILSGDIDANAPIEINRALLESFPDATLMTVAGAGHDAAASFWTSCGPKAVVTFFDTLKVDPTACATP